ncbi:MAG: hypothetical protein JST87_07725 [Bacteroidetes bacterium]|nr:hypothetical protein [Bacteroidota bacterium]MBS1933246.1 hypothetical protein [Bacteroidota bacterium]
MQENNYITSSCRISNHTIYKNGGKIFEEKNIVFADFLIAAYAYFNLNYPKFYKMDSLSKLGWLASEIVLKDTFKAENYKPADVGIVLANANSSLDTDLKYFESTKEFASPSLFVYTLPNIVMGEICIRNKFKGENAFFIQEKFDADFIEQYVNNLVNNNILQACICGWVDVLQEDYEALLFLVEKNKTENAIAFSTANMNVKNH